jgi:hypothetical protein
LSRLSHHRPNDFFGNTVPTEVPDEPLDVWPRREALGIASQTLSDVGTDERLVSREAEQWGDPLELFHDVFRHAQRDAGHRPVLAQSFSKVTDFHMFTSPVGWQAVPR